MLKYTKTGNLVKPSTLRGKTVQGFDQLLIETNQVRYLRRVDRTIDRSVRRLEPVLQRMFRRQLAEVNKRLTRFETLLTESSEDEKRRAKNLWATIWQQVVKITVDEATDSLQELGEAIFQEGATSLLDFLGDPVPISFEVVNRAAIAFRRADKAIKGINETTQAMIDTLLDEVIEQGTSYNKFAKTLEERFTEFSKKRAKRIAVFEIRDRHAGGQTQAAKQLQKEGLIVEKRWVSRGDSKVRPEHEEYDKLGYIPEDQEFKTDSGEAVPRPPTDPGCRCVIVRRLKVRT